MTDNVLENSFEQYGLTLSMWVLHLDRAGNAPGRPRRFDQSTIIYNIRCLYNRW